MAHLRKLRRVEIEVNVVEDGGWINWAEQGNTGMSFKRLVKAKRRKDMKISVTKRLNARGIQLDQSKRSSMSRLEMTSKKGQR